MDIRNGLLSVYNGVSASVGTSNAFDIYKSTSGYVRVFNNGRLWVGSGTPADAGYQADFQGTVRIANTYNLTFGGSSAGIRIGEGASIESTYANQGLIVIGNNTFASMSANYLGNAIAIGSGAGTKGEGLALGPSSIVRTGINVWSGDTSFTSGVFIYSTITVSSSAAVAINSTIGNGNLNYQNVGINAAIYGNNNIGISSFIGPGISSSFVVGQPGDNNNFGDINSVISDVYFGSGIDRTMKDGTRRTGFGWPYTINGSGASGSNFAGGNIRIAGGKGTGNAVPGDIVFATPVTGSSGVILQTLVDRWYIKGNSGALTNRNISHTSSFVLDVSGPVSISGSLTMTGSVAVTGSLTVNGVSVTGGGSGTGLTVASGSTAATLTQIYSVLTGSARAAFYNYAALSESNARAGQISAVWFGTTASYNETTTTDIGNTNNVLFRVAISGSFVNLNVTASAGWLIKTTAILV
jgi:hypothetical protein